MQGRVMLGSHITALPFALVKVPFAHLKVDELVGGSNDCKRTESTDAAAMMSDSSDTTRMRVAYRKPVVAIVLQDGNGGALTLTQAARGNIETKIAPT
jgi:hypothetical protein